MNDPSDATHRDLQALDALVDALTTEARQSGAVAVAQAAVALGAFRHRAAERDPAALGLAGTLRKRPELWVAMGARRLDG